LSSLKGGSEACLVAKIKADLTYVSRYIKICSEAYTTYIHPKRQKCQRIGKLMKIRNGCHPFVKIYQNMKTLSKNNESLKIVDVRGMLQIDPWGDF
jgi:hypothetical protein